MSWYQNAVFYHIYPLGQTGAPLQNPYGEPVRRLVALCPWVDHLAGLGFNALYIGPLFESVGHVYETTDYRRLDSRLGSNEDLKAFVSYCHGKGVRVILDAVFNHTGRDFFAFRDLLERHEPGYFVHGHIHQSYGTHIPRVTDFGNTKVINACGHYAFSI